MTHTHTHRERERERERERDSFVLFFIQSREFYRLTWMGRKDMFYLTTHSTHFILRLYGVGHMVKDHSDSEREKTRCRHMGYSFRLTARVLLYAPSHRQYSTYHGLCYTSRGALAGTRNSSICSPHEGSIRRPIAP